MKSNPMSFWFAFDDKKLARHLRRLELKARTAAPAAVKELCELIDERAMDNLDSKVKWGHSIEHENIRDTFDYSEIEDTGRYFKRTVKYTSPHAWIVEHGALGESPESKSGKLYPIGQEQGNAQAFVKTFKLQEGYHYLENAMKSITKSEIDRIFFKNMEI